MAKVWDVLAPRNLELGPPSADGVAGTVWRHWKLARDDNGIAWLVFDKSGASTNTLNEEVLTELNEALTRIERELPKGVVLRSAKKNGFIAGADIGGFRSMTDVVSAEQLLRQAHAVIDPLGKVTGPGGAGTYGYC